MNTLMIGLLAAVTLSTFQLGSAALSDAEAHASKRNHTHKSANRRSYRSNPKRLDPQRRFDYSGTYDGYPGWAAAAFTRHEDPL